MRALPFILAILFSLSTAAQTGNVGIGTNTPSDQLHTTGTVRFQNYAGAGTRLVQMDTAGRLSVPSGGSVFSESPNLAIPDGGCGTSSGAVSQLQAYGQPATIASREIAVRVNISHTYDGDLRIYLKSPGGVILNLAYSNGGSGDNFTNTVFTDESPNLLPATGAPFTGSCRPAGNTSTQCGNITPTVSTFSAMGGGNINPNGVWTLYVFDASNTDVGTLLDWGITFMGEESFVTVQKNNFLALFRQGGLETSSLYQGFYGNVGLGLTEGDLDARLHIANAGSTLLQLENTNPLSATTTTDLAFKNGSRYTGLIRTRGTSATTSALGLFTGASASTYYLTERLSILDNGNVGIGDTDPTYKLTVAGDIRSTGNISAAGHFSASTLTLSGVANVGSIKVTGGTPAPAKVLTSTSTAGDASWQPLPSYNTGLELVKYNTTFSGGTMNYISGYSEQLDDANACVPSTGIYTFPATGRYLLTVHAHGNTQSSLSQTRHTDILYTINNIAYSLSGAASEGTFGYFNQTVSTIISASANQQLRIAAQTNGQGTYTTDISVRVVLYRLY